MGSVGAIWTLMNQLICSYGMGDVAFAHRWARAMGRAIASCPDRHPVDILQDVARITAHEERREGDSVEMAAEYLCHFWAYSEEFSAVWRPHA